MQVKTIDSEQVWQSPDGEKKIWSVKLETPEGKDYQLKTYSEAIAKPNFNGEVYSYLDKRGERFVRQATKAPAEAGAAIPNELIDLVTLCGPADVVRDRIDAFRDAGVDTLGITPMAFTVEDRIAQLRSVAELAA